MSVGDAPGVLGGKKGVFGSTATAPTGSAAMTEALGIGEMMAWLKITMDQSDAQIRDQMKDLDAKKELAAELAKILTAMKNAENWKADSPTGRNCTDVEKLLVDFDKQDWFKKLPDSAKDAVTRLVTDIGADHLADEGTVKSAREAIADHIATLSSSNEMAMVKLQSAIAARGQGVQLISNMINAFNETNNRIIGNVK